MKLKCPSCEVESDFPDNASGKVECPFCGESFSAGGPSAVGGAASRRAAPSAGARPEAAPPGEDAAPPASGGNAPAVCPICCCEIAPGDDVVICPDCRTPHHRDCWEENHGCSTYGCASAAHQETHTDSTNGGNAAGTPDGMVACPACGAMHPATDLVCSSCGKLLGDDLPGASAGARLRDTAGKLGDSAKNNLWPRLTRNFRLLGRDIAAVCRLWWGEFSRYATFTGKTNRRGLLAFSLVNYAISRILFLTDAGVLLLVFNLVILLPGLAVSVRRLRDTDISPWMIFAFPILPFLLLVPSVPTSEVPPQINHP